MIIREPSWKSYILESTDPVFTPQQCRSIIDTGNSLPQMDARVGGEKKGGSTDHKKRKTNIAWIPFKRMPQMYSVLEQWMHMVNENHFGFDKVQISEQAQFTKYSKGHHYDWHSDTSFVFNHEPIVRKISMVTLLNDPKEFKGGEMQILNSEEKLSLKQGYAIFFASFITHRVLPVTKGMRISMPMWFGGTPLR